MLQQNCWIGKRLKPSAGEPELAMAVKVIGRPILIYRTSGASFFSKELVKASEYGVDGFVSVPPVCLLYDSMHYDSLLVQWSHTALLCQNYMQSL